MSTWQKGKKIVVIRVSALFHGSAAGWVLFATILTVAPPVFADVDLPEGKGKDIVEAVCSDCHDFERIVRQSLTLDQWRNTLREMMENGATLNAEDVEPLLAYLARNFGPGKKTAATKVNVNTATAKEISAGLQLTPAEAEAIVAYRTANRAFREIGDLEKVPKLDMKKIGAQKELIVF